MRNILFCVLVAMLSSSCIFKMLAIEQLDYENVGWSVANETDQNILVELTRSKLYIIEPQSAANYYLYTPNPEFDSYWSYLQSQYGVQPQMKIYTANKDVLLKEWSLGEFDNNDQHYFFDENSWVKGKHEAGFTMWTFTLTDEDLK